MEKIPEEIEPEMVLARERKEMGRRLKVFRKTRRYSQSEIAAELGVTQTTVSSYETGNITDWGITLICNKFQINEDWLRYGRGEMDLPAIRQNGVSGSMGAVSSLGGLTDVTLLLKSKLDLPEFCISLILAYAELSEAERSKIKVMIQALADSMNKGKNPNPPSF